MSRLTKDIGLSEIGLNSGLSADLNLTSNSLRGDVATQAFSVEMLTRRFRSTFLQASIGGGKRGILSSGMMMLKFWIEMKT